MSLFINKLMRYAPALILDRLAKDPAPLTDPVAETFPAAVLFADISGFSALTEKLTRDNPRGVEDLTNILDIYIGKIVEIVTGHGGDIVKFAGDALFAVWRADDYEDLKRETHRATRCGVIIQNKLDHFKVASGVTLSLRVGLGAGELHALHVGGTFRRWELLIAGDPMNQVSQAGKVAEPGQVVISPQANKLIRQLNGGRVSGGRFLISHIPETEDFNKLERNPVGEEAEEALQSYIPRAILSRLEAGYENSSVDLRKVTVLFLKVSDFRFGGVSELGEVQRIMKVMQNCLYTHEGSINRFGVDDKGAILLAAFGLPPLDHEDDPIRGLYAARDLRKTLRGIGQDCKIGLATGTVFCGPVGNETRSEYTMHAHVVNMAARLMVVAETVLCDEATYQEASSVLNFQRQPPIQLKGVKDPTVSYIPLMDGLD